MGPSARACTGFPVIGVDDGSLVGSMRHEVQDGLAFGRIPLKKVRIQRRRQAFEGLDRADLGRVHLRKVMARTSDSASSINSASLRIVGAAGRALCATGFWRHRHHSGRRRWRGRPKPRRRPLLPPWASALSRKRPRHLAKWRGLATAALRPSWAVEEPARPRAATAGQLAQEAVRKVSASDRADIHSESLAPAVRVHADRNDDGDGDDTAVDDEPSRRWRRSTGRPIACRRPVEEGFDLAVDLYRTDARLGSWKCRSCRAP